MGSPESASRRLASTFAIALLAAALAVGPATVPDGHRDVPPPAELLVSAQPGAVERARAVIEDLGGTVDTELPLIDGYAVRIPATAVAELRADPSVRAIRVDAGTQVQSNPGDGATGPASAYREAMGAAELSARGLTGQGVTVAVLDTGVSEVPDLAGKLVPITDPLTGRTTKCVDFSGEDHCDDTYGHGTFMAGIIAGSGASSGGRWAGVAPDARILSLKVAGRDGSSDVSKVIAAIQWAVSHKDQYDISVLNLSLGTNSVQRWDVDPFNYAVERAWRAGIVVTVAASNRGPGPATVSKPGDDPWVITVGAIDDHGTATPADDRLPDFSSRGPTAHGEGKPDVVAPGVRLVSLRVPGSEIDARFPTYVDGAHRRGSGTSMATAAVAGGVAQLLEQHPGWSPNQVKEALRSTARPTVSDDPAAVGAGLVDLAAAAESSPSPGGGDQPNRRSSGLGSLHLSRGGLLVDGVTVSETLVGALLTTGTILWDPVGILLGWWSPTTWRLSVWATHRWHTTTWTGDNWQGNNWHGNNWHGDFDGSTRHGAAHDDTYGMPWKGAAWYGLWD